MHDDFPMEPHEKLDYFPPNMSNICHEAFSALLIFTSEMYIPVRRVLSLMRGGAFKMLHD